MNATTRIGLELIAVGLVLGLAGDALLHGAALGANAALWTGLFVGAALVQAWRWRRAVWRVGWPWFALVGAGALLFAWRDAAALKGLDVGVVAVLTAAGVARVQRTGQAARGGPLRVGARVLLDLPRFVVRDVDWAAAGAGQRGQAVRAAARGAVLAGPVVVVFGGLLAAADAAFAGLVDAAVAVGPASVPGHLAWIIGLAWIGAATVRGLLLPVASVAPAARREGPLGIVEVGVVLGAVNVLFAAFVATQVPYLFGGAGDSAGSVAAWARRGFFELAAVAGLALPLLLGLQRVLTVRSGAEQRLFRALAGVHVGLLAVILASAAYRMALYAATFGLTEARVLVAGALAWIGLVLGWFVLSALRGRPERFARGAVAAGLAVVVALHAVNPHALVARVNVARAAEGRPFDVAYAATLSADAVPALVAALPHLAPADRVQVARDLHRRRAALAGADWRAWNAGQAAARRRLAAVELPGGRTPIAETPYAARSVPSAR